MSDGILHALVSRALVLPVVLAVLGCGDDGPSGPAVDLDIAPNPDVDQTSSYTLQKTDLWVMRGEVRSGSDAPWNVFIHAIAYADFDADGDTDVILAPGDGSDQAIAAELPVLLLSSASGLAELSGWHRSRPMPPAPAFPSRAPTRTHSAGHRVMDLMSRRAREPGAALFMIALPLPASPARAWEGDDAPSAPAADAADELARHVERTYPLQSVA